MLKLISHSYDNFLESGEKNAKVISDLMKTGTVITPTAIADRTDKLNGIFQQALAAKAEGMKALSENQSSSSAAQ